MIRFRPQKQRAALTLVALFTSLSSGLSIAALAQTAPRRAVLQFDFNGANPWPKTAMDVMPSTPLDITTSIEIKAVGTVDKTGATQPSGAMLIKAEVGEVGLPWIATYNSGLLPVQNTQTDLSQLRLCLDLSASSARAVIVRVESFNAKKNRTGGLETTLTPAAPDVYQHFALDLSQLQSSGEGHFNPTDPHLQISFELRNPAWPDKATHELRVDNVLLDAPA